MVDAIPANEPFRPNGGTVFLAQARGESQHGLGDHADGRRGRSCFRGAPLATGILLLLTLLAVGLPLTAQAQPPGKVARIGYLGNSSPALERDFVDAFRQGLRELGYAEGHNLLIEFRWAEGRYERFPELIAELVRRKVDVILTAGTPGALAAKQATQTTPIVMAVSGDAVGTGLVRSLARPDGNLTGLTRMTRDLDGKRLELLKEIVPRLSRVAMLLNPTNPISALGWKEAVALAETLHLTLEPVEVRAAEDFETARAAITRQRPGALFIIADQFLLASRTQVVDFAAHRSLPAMYPNRGFVDAGGLISYAANDPAMFRSAATFVDKILKGAKPGDLPIEQPTTFELVINLKTAKTLGLAIPQSVLIRADEVIQ
jgi:putative ABC transport system substrate-binding protein